MDREILERWADCQAGTDGRIRAFMYEKILYVLYQRLFGIDTTYDVTYNKDDDFALEVDGVSVDEDDYLDVYAERYWNADMGSKILEMINTAMERYFGGIVDYIPLYSCEISEMRYGGSDDAELKEEAAAREIAWYNLDEGLFTAFPRLKDTLEEILLDDESARYTLLYIKSDVLGQIFEWCMEHKELPGAKEAMRLINQAVDPLRAWTQDANINDGTLYAITFVGAEEGCNPVSVDGLEASWLPSLTILKELIESLNREHGILGGLDGNRELTAA